MEGSAIDIILLHAYTSATYSKWNTEQLYSEGRMSEECCMGLASAMTMDCDATKIHTHASCIEGDVSEELLRDMFRQVALKDRHA